MYCIFNCEAFKFFETVELFSRACKSEDYEALACCSIFSRPVLTFNVHFAAAYICSDFYGRCEWENIIKLMEALAPL